MGVRTCLVNHSIYKTHAYYYKYLYIIMCIIIMRVHVVDVFKRTFQFSYRGWSTCSFREDLYARIMCVYFLFIILYYVKECKFGEVCVVLYAYVIWGKNSQRDVNVLRHRDDDGNNPEKRERVCVWDCQSNIREEERPTADLISRFHGQ